MSAYTSLGGGRRSKSSSSRRSVADYEAEVRREQRLERLDDVQRLHDELVLHLVAHREEFPPIAKPTVTRATINLEARIEHARRDAVENISAVKVGQRRAAREAAEATARRQAHVDQDLENQRAAEEQAILDAVWDRLLGNDPTTVLATIEDAFADNEVPAAPIDSDGDAVTLLMRFPSVHGVVPTHAPDETPTGRRTMREYSKTERNALHVGAMLSHAYATVAETFAVAPGIQSTTLLVVASDASSLTPVYAAQVDRPAFESGAWLQDSVAVFAPGHLINLSGRTQELAPLSVEHEPGRSRDLQRGPRSSCPSGSLSRG